MFSGAPSSPQLRPSLLRRLDYLPGWLGVTLGVGAGALLGGALALAAPPLVAGAGFLALLGLAVALARSGAPISVIDAPTESPPERPAEREPTPPQVDDGVALVSIPGGVFLMGSADDEPGRRDHEGPRHEVRIAAFECMRYPVTRRLYRELIGKDPGWPDGEADERPVNQVSWNDAIGFCNRLSQRSGLTPCYRIDAAGQATWEPAANGYRLLTEAEWEYACRAGSRTRYSFGDDDSALGDHAWYAANSGGTPHPVGSRKPNRWGLHDLHGNVWEWCWDRYGRYSSAAQDDPIGPPTGEERVLRGGAFSNSAVNLRSALRIRVRAENRFNNFGFRCARGPRRQP